MFEVSGYVKLGYSIYKWTSGGGHGIFFTCIVLSLKFSGLGV